jgi:hypothetical protein
MSIEKSITNIRKAVKGSAEELALKESLNEAEYRHYEYIIKLYKQIRNLDPKLLDKIVNITAKGKELKDEAGSILYNSYNEVWKEIFEGANGFENKIHLAINSSEKNMTSEDFKQELVALTEKLLKEKSEKLKEDPRIIKAFKDKKELLNKLINYTIQTPFQLLEA